MRRPILCPATLREIFDAQSKNITAAAEEFPVDKYTYHPTPEGRTVGNTVGHIAQVNNFALRAARWRRRPAQGEYSRDG